MKWMIEKIIRFYQKYLSPDQGILSSLLPQKTCRFHPTCSEYMRQAVLKYGILKGGWLGAKRILRCHPWNEGGEDPLP